MIFSQFCSLLLIEKKKISFHDLAPCAQQKGPSALFGRSERLGRKYVLYSPCLQRVIFAFVHCVSHSVRMFLSTTSFGEATLSPELASRKAWTLTSGEKWGLAVIHRKTEQVYRAPADFLESPLSCTAASHLTFPRTDTKRQDFWTIDSCYSDCLSKAKTNASASPWAVSSYFPL